MTESTVIGLENEAVRQAAHEAHLDGLAVLKKDHDGEIVEQIKAYKLTGLEPTDFSRVWFDQLTRDIGHHVDALKLMH